MASCPRWFPSSRSSPLPQRPFGREARRAQATRTIEWLFNALALTPRLPAPLVGDVTVAFVDGLAGEAAIEPEANHRLRFDVFWLSVLNLAE